MQITLALGLIAAVAAPATVAGDELLERVEARQRSVVDLEARFVQSYRSGMLGHEIVESGTVAVKRPGRMRWEYQKPEPKTFVADGERFYFYVPADRQVMIQPQAGARGVAVVLLSGTGSIAEQFRAERVSGESRLRLVPREPDPDVSEVLVDVGPDGQILVLDVLDVQSNRSRYEFRDVRVNVGLPDRLFEFEPPAGVEVIEG